MDLKLFILLSMIFFHIVDDYYLQGVLVSMKQKQWWKENYPDVKYRFDYIIALLMHSFSWAFMIMIPLAVYSVLKEANLYLSLYIINMVIHAYVDDTKANKLRISLVADQVIHLLQIFITWVCIVYQ